MAYTELEIDWLEEIIVPAIDPLYTNFQNHDLLHREVNERTVVADVSNRANLLLLVNQVSKPVFRNLYIDIEYNRNGLTPKEIFVQCLSCEENCTNRYTKLQNESYPDMIIHQRGNNKNNQVVLEFKKENNSAVDSREKDFAKLKYFTCKRLRESRNSRDYQYKIGYFIDLKKDSYTITAFQNAEEVETKRRIRANDLRELKRIQYEASQKMTWDSNE